MDYHPFKQGNLVERSRSTRFFEEGEGSVQLEEMETLFKSIRNIPQAGDIDALYLAAMVSTDEYKGIIFIEDGFFCFKDMPINGGFDEIYPIDALGEVIDFYSSSASLFIFGDISILSEKYKHLGYNYLLLMAGMVSQNVYTVCEKLSMKCCSLGCYDQDKAKEIVFEGTGIDTENIISLTNIIIGK